MKGIILAAGMGTRLMPLTKEIPKALLQINNETLLERMIKNCINAGISEYKVVVGYNKDKVIDLCPKLEEKYDIKIETVFNEKYDVTNTSCSTYLASKDIDDDFILINGDNVINPQIVINLAKSKNTGLIIDNYKELNEESFKIKIANKTVNGEETIANGQIEAIGKGLDISTSFGEFIGVSKVVKEDIDEFNRILVKLIKEDPQNYYDFAYEELSAISTIDYVLTNGLKWTEIDDHTDWENAQKLVAELEN